MIFEAQKQVILGVLAGATLRQLRSGHSHEDIDQCFGSLALFLVKHGRVVETPSQFRDLIVRFCEAAQRPHEPERAVVLLDQHRPWNLLNNYLHCKIFPGKCFERAQ